MDPVLEDVLVELLVDLPADADVPIVASAPERTWLWSDLHLSDASVLPGWGRPFRSVEEKNRHLLRNWRRRVVADEYRVYSDDGTTSPAGCASRHRLRRPREGSCAGFSTGRPDGPSLWP